MMAKDSQQEENLCNDGRGGSVNKNAHKTRRKKENKNRTAKKDSRDVIDTTLTKNVSEKQLGYFQDKWVGDHYASKDGCKFYEVAHINVYSERNAEATDKDIFAGSCVELKTDDEPPYLVKIDKLYEQSGIKYMISRYFYRHEDVAKKELKRLSKSICDKDIFISNDVVTNRLSCIDKVWDVYYDVPTNRIYPHEAGLSRYWCRFRYDVKLGKLAAMSHGNVVKEKPQKKSDTRSGKYNNLYRICLCCDNESK